MTGIGRTMSEAEWQATVSRWRAGTGADRIAELEAELAEWKDTARQWQLNAEINAETVAECREELAAARASRQKMVVALKEELAAAERAIKDCGIGDIYGDFRDPADVVRQTAHYIKEQERKLAAAEAQCQAVIRLLAYPEWVSGDDGQGPRWCPNCRMLEPDGHTSDCIHSILDAWLCDSHAALDAALEQVRAEEQERWRPLVQRLLAIFQGDWPGIKAQLVEGRWTWLPVDDEARDAIVAARKAIRAEGTE